LVQADTFQLSSLLLARQLSKLRLLDLPTATMLEEMFP
jgi:hypothetical protein